jgi:hypothetical protein
MVLRPQSGIRNTLALLNDIAAAASSDIEIIARVRFPSGVDGFFEGGGAVARVGDVFTSYAGYGAVYNDGGLPSGNSAIRGTLITAATEIDGASVVVFPNLSNVWLRVLLRVNGSNVRAWFGNDAGWTKTNASTPDAEATDTTYTAGLGGGIRWDTNSSTPMEIDWIGWGTAGDAAPQAPLGGATQLGFLAQPQTTQVGSVLPAFTVRALTSGGTVDTAYTGNITVAIQTGTGGISGTPTRAAVAGVATFNNISFDTVQTGLVLRATATGLTLADSSGFNITAPAGGGGGTTVGGSPFYASVFG